MIRSSSTRAAAIVAAAAMLVLCEPAQARAQAGIKCWTNNQGVRECGNSVPPEYSQKGYTEKSETGRTKAVRKRAKTQEEIAAAAAEKARMEAERIEQERLAAIQAEKDRVLLSTYATEEDLELTRNGKLAAIDSRIKHTTQIIAGLERKLDELKLDAARQERSGKRVGADIHQKIASVRKQLQDNEAFIVARTEEKGQIESSYEAELARWRELKGR